MRLCRVMVALAVLATPVAAQRDSTAADSAPRRSSGFRAGWLSDRSPLRAGDLVTVVVDEETAASERVSTVAVGDRGQRATLGASLDPFYSFGADKGVVTGMQTDSRDVGEANREGNLTAVITVRVAALEPNGVARIEGSKQVRVDGRLQTVRVAGLIRQEDVMPNHLVLSSRIADAEITYQGKKIGPRTGIIGKILSILWP